MCVCVCICENLWVTLTGDLFIVVEAWIELTILFGLANNGKLLFKCFMDSVE